MTVNQLINELNTLNAPGAIVNVAVTASIDDTARGPREITLDGPAEVVERIHLQEGPAVRICARNGAESDA